MRGLIPLPILIPFCPIGGMNQLVREWEEAYGEPYICIFDDIGETVLSAFNGKPLPVRMINVPGITRSQLNQACLRLYRNKKLKRVSHGVYIKQ